MKTNIKKFIKENLNEMFNILKELCAIPAPSHFEHRRAEYCKKWLEEAGAEGVYIDEALNVVFSLNCEKINEITVFVAHTDTVFPDTEPMPYLDDGEKIHCPGVADNTASVVVLMMMAKYFLKNNILSNGGIMFVCNSCEEGLGNLKGTRQIFKNYEGRIKRFISFDSELNVISDKCVGSHRYNVEVTTEGGHSYGMFGNDNAILKLSKIISEIYKIKVPQKEGTKTTYNVGTISGGTSINTIAQNAKMLCEYRSDDKECLDTMQKKFEDIFENARLDNTILNITRVGDRPCGNTDENKIKELVSISTPLIEQIIDEKVIYKSSSTDCNIPLSLGIPAICVGVSNFDGIHTHKEWLEKKSLAKGLEVAITLGLKLTER